MLNALQILGPGMHAAPCRPITTKQPKLNSNDTDKMPLLSKRKVASLIHATTFSAQHAGLSSSRNRLGSLQFPPRAMASSVSKNFFFAPLLESDVVVGKTEASYDQVVVWPRHQAPQNERLNIDLQAAPALEISVAALLGPSMQGSRSLRSLGRLYRQLSLQGLPL